MVGGAGADTFEIHPRGMVRIKDFQPKHDVLDLSAITGWSWGRDGDLSRVYSQNGDVLAILNRAPDLEGANLV